MSLDRITTQIQDGACARAAPVFVACTIRIAEQGGKHWDDHHEGRVVDIHSVHTECHRPLWRSHSGVGAEALSTSACLGFLESATACSAAMRYQSVCMVASNAMIQ